MAATNTPAVATGLPAPGFTPTGTFVGYADGIRRTFRLAAEIMEVLVTHRNRMLADFDPPDDESLFTSDDDDTITSWHTTDSAATDEIEVIVEQPVTATPARPSAQEKAQEPNFLHRESYTNAMMEWFLPRARGHADTPVIRNNAHGHLIMVYDRKPMSYANVLKLLRRDCLIWVRVIDRSLGPSGNVTQGYSPICQAVFELCVEWNMGRLNPAMKMNVAEKKDLRWLNSAEEPGTEEKSADRKPAMKVIVPEKKEFERKMSGEERCKDQKSADEEFQGQEFAKMEAEQRFKLSQAKHEKVHSWLDMLE